MWQILAKAKTQKSDLGIFRLNYDQIFTKPHQNTLKCIFFTDLDTLSFKIQPGKTYDFVILLNGKDSAYTQIKYEAETSQSSYLTILKKGSKYDSKDNRPILKWTYKSEQSPELVQMRQVFNLDSIAGAGDELSKIFNLLHWVHNSFRFDGTKELPAYDGIVDLMTKCYNSNHTMYCGALASVLNECYKPKCTNNPDIFWAKPE